MKFEGIVFSDIHFGSMDSSKLFNELQYSLLDYISLKVDNLDLVVISGDYFDKLLYLNDNHTYYASLFMIKLIDIIKKFNAKLRIVYGTESHECNQYEYLNEWINNSNIDYRLIKTVQEECINNMMILYVPEEYIYNKSDYYKNYFNNENKYDYIFGHGVINELMPSSVHVNKKSTNSNRLKVPTFNSNELSHICKGEVFFGHYHINSTINDNIHYCGSFSRTKFGEEEDKGFYHFTYKNNKYKSNFIINTLATKYNTIYYGYNSIIFKSMDNLSKELDKITNNIKNDRIDGKLRLVFNLPEDYENGESVILYIQERFKGIKNIKVEFNNGFVNRVSTVNKTYLNETVKKYGSVFDKSLSLEDKSSQYIKIKYNEDISSDKIKQHFITDDILNLKD